MLFRKQHSLQNAMFYEESFGQNQALYAHLTYAYRDVERFRNGSVREFYSLKVSQISKLRPCSHELTKEPYMSSNFEDTMCDKLQNY